MLLIAPHHPCARPAQMPVVLPRSHQIRRRDSRRPSPQHAPQAPRASAASSGTCAPPAPASCYRCTEHSTQAIRYRGTQRVNVLSTRSAAGANVPLFRCSRVPRPSLACPPRLAQIAPTAEPAHRGAPAHPRPLPVPRSSTRPRLQNTRRALEARRAAAPSCSAPYHEKRAAHPPPDSDRRHDHRTHGCP